MTRRDAAVRLAATIRAPGREHHLGLSRVIAPRSFARARRESLTLILAVVPPGPVARARPKDDSLPGDPELPSNHARAKATRARSRPRAIAIPQPGSLLQRTSGRRVGRSAAHARFRAAKRQRGVLTPRDAWTSSRADVSSRPVKTSAHQRSSRRLAPRRVSAAARIRPEQASRRRRRRRPHPRCIPRFGVRLGSTASAQEAMRSNALPGTGPQASGAAGRDTPPGD